MIVPTSPGGINDNSGRIVARHMGRHIPGKPNFVVQNQPGAGGIAGANLLYNSAEKDGSVISMIERAVSQFSIMGDPNAKFDPLKYTWLGSLSSYGDDAYLMLVNSKHAAQSVADISKPGITINLGGNRTGSTNLTFALIGKEVLGLNINVIRGYTGRGADDARHAARRARRPGDRLRLGAVGPAGPVEAARRCVRSCSSAASRGIRISRTSPRAASWPSPTPTGRSSSSPSCRSLMALPVTAPPSIPADRAKVLQAAFAAMVKDKAFLDDAARLGLEISPIDADQIRSLIARAAATPKDVIERYKKLVGDVK